MEQVLMGIVTLVIVLIVRRKEALTLRWKPTQDTWMAIGIGLLAFAFSAVLLLFDSESLTARVIHYGLIYVLCGVALPWGYTLWVERNGIAALGIKREKWLPSLILSLVLTGLFSLVIIFEADLQAINWGQFAKAMVPLVGAGGLFELFLYYGFIHPRLEKAFGALPAILVTAALYVAWHTGTQLPLEPDIGTAIVKLFAIGVMYQAIFSLTHNLLVIWPLFHGVGVMIDFTVNLSKLEIVSRRFGWGLGAVVVMLMTLGYILLSERKRRQSALTPSV